MSDDLQVVIDATAIHPRSGGAGTYVRSLLGALPEVGVHPIVIARKNDDSLWIGAGSVHRIAPNNRAVRLIWEQTNLVRAILRFVPSGEVVLHSPHYTTPRKVPARVHRVVTIHDLTFFSRPTDHDRMKRVLFTSSIRKSAQLANVIVAVSHATAAEYSNVTGRTDNIVVAQHGVDHNRFFPKHDQPTEVRTSELALLKREGIASRFVLFLGTVEPRKQVSALISAFAVISQDPALSDVQLVIAGQMWSGMESSLPACGPRERRLGYVDDQLAAMLFRHAAVVCYPSAEEGFGLPLIEAMASGVPVVAAASDISQEVCGAAAQLVSLNPSASFSTRLAEALAAALSGSHPDPHIGITTSAAFTWKQSALRHLVAFRQALDSHK
jgi:glycosyltransferase involved in cell wall biosynthesis